MQNQTEQNTEVVTEKPAEVVVEKPAEPIFRVKVKSSIKGGKAPIQSCS